MNKTVEFFYDFVSSASYIAYKRLPEKVKAAGGQIVWKPMLLGGVFKAVGNTGPNQVQGKGEWMFDDLKRTADKHGIRFARNPDFPLNTVMALRGAIAAEKINPEIVPAYMDTMFDASWANGNDLGKPEVVMELLEKADLPANEIANMVQDQAIKDELRANTEEAVRRGAFGAPTFFVNGEMHWGQDRINDVIEALDKKE